METFGCSFFVHSGWVSGSNGVAVGVAGTADFCVRTRGRRRRSRKRPAIDEGVESREDGVMVMTSPLTAKVGHWDTASKEKKQLEHLGATFLQPPSKKNRLSLSHFKIVLFSPTFNSCGRPPLSSAQRNREGIKELYKGKKKLLAKRTRLWDESKEMRHVLEKQDIKLSKLTQKGSHRECEGHIDEKQSEETLQ